MRREGRRCRTCERRSAEDQEALKRMKRGKGFGPDDILVKVWRCLGETGVGFLPRLFNNISERGEGGKKSRRMEEAPRAILYEEVWSGRTVC